MKILVCFIILIVGLFAVNYLICGAPKIWYVVPAAFVNDFLDLTKNFTAESQCKKFNLFHKNLFMNPDFFEGKIPIKKIVQKPGDLVVTAPWAWHSGWNVDNNLAEASNFFLEDNLVMEKGIKVNVCGCKSFKAELAVEVDGKQVTLHEAVKKVIYNEYK